MAQDCLKMLTRDLKKLLKDDSLTDSQTKYLKEYVELYLNQIPGDTWEDEEIAVFNEFGDNNIEVNLSPLATLLYQLKVPYFYYCDGDWEYDDSETYYHPIYAPQTIECLIPRSYNGYAITLSQLNKLKNLDAEAFKEEVFRLAKEPFSNVPSLEEIVVKRLF